MARSIIGLGFMTPLVLIAVAAGVWAGAWFVIANEAEARIDEAIVDASARGTTLACAEKWVGGFPFRIEFNCRAPQLALESARSRLTISAAQLIGVALVYDVDRVIIEVTGPATVDTFELGGRRSRHELAAATARASVEVPDGVFQAVSVELTKVDAKVASLALLETGAGSGLTADRALLHFRHAGDNQQDIAAKIDNAHVEGELARIYFETPQLDVEVFDLVARMTEADAFNRTAAAWTGRMSAWQSAGGELQVQKLLIEAPALDVELSGTGRLDAAGRAEGKFRGAFGKLDLLIEDLKSRGVLDKNGARVAAGAIGLLARPVDGSARAELPVRVEAGDVYLGPIKTMEIPAVF